MYYEEQVIDGQLCYRNAHDGPWVVLEYPYLISRLMVAESRNRTFDQAREALKHFASNDDWGRVLAWIVGGAPSRQEGIEMARKIVKWQSQAEQSLAAMEATHE